MFERFPLETIYSYPASLIQDDFEKASCIFMNHDFTGDSRSKNAIYIHIPFCISLCNFCGFAKTNHFSKNLIADYVKALHKEIDFILSNTGKKIPVNTIYFGGGSASVLETLQVEDILNKVYKSFDVQEGVNITFEGECRTLLKKNFLTELQGLGVTRLSFGAQVMDEDYRKLMNLKPSLNELYNLNEQAKKKFDDVCLDYIFGWPNQGLEHLTSDLEFFLKTFAPYSVDFFQLEKLDAAPEFIKFLLKEKISFLETPELIQMYDKVMELSCKYSLDKYSYTFFSSEKFDYLNSYFACFYGIDDAGVIGLGTGSQSFYKNIMWGNTYSVNEYIKRVLSGKPAISSVNFYGKGERESVTWPRVGKISLNKLEQYGMPYLEKLNILEKNGYVEYKEDALCLTKKGGYWVPNIMELLVSNEQMNLFNEESKRKHAGRTLELQV